MILSIFNVVVLSDAPIERREFKERRAQWVRISHWSSMVLPHVFSIVFSGNRTHRGNHRWATALGQKEKQAQRITTQFEKGILTPEETWAEVVRVYGD